MTMFRKFFTVQSGWWKIPGSAAFIILVWLFFWYWHWQTMLQDLVWLRMGIGLSIFIIPGFCVYGLLADRSIRWLNHIPFGFVLSHLIFACLGTLGRLIHAPFELIRFLMMLLGLVSLLACVVPRIQGGNALQIQWAGFSSVFSTTPLAFVLLLVSFIVIQRVLSDDDLTYLVYITNWQHSPRLDFNDLIFGEGHLLHSRFWLMSASFAQALISDLSGLPGVLILGGYYEPFLVFVSMIAWYELARTMRLSHQAASVSVILQMLFLLLLSEYLHPGAPFFNQLSSDKSTATFILAPVFFQSAVWLMQQPTRRNIALFLLSGLSMTFMHPISLAYLVFIGSLFVFLNTNRSNFQTRLIPLSVLVFILVPQVVFRFFGARPGEGIPYDTEDILAANGLNNLVSQLGDTRFYGINLNSLAMKIPYESMIPVPTWILDWGWMLIPIASILFAVPQLRKDYLAQYIFSAFILCAFVWIPYTGWFVGYFLSAWMLERALWFFPFGLSAVFLLLAILHQTTLGHRIDKWMDGLKIATRIKNLPLLVVTIFTLTIFLLFMRENGLPDFESFRNKTRRYEDIARVGRYLDRKIRTQAIVIGSDALNDFIPGVSWKSKLITYRISDPSNMLYFGEDVIEERKSDRQVIFSETASPETKMELLRKYDVRFIVLIGADRDLFADLLTTHPSLTKMEKVNRFFVIEIKDE